MRRIFVVVSTVLLLSTIVQFYLAASAAFSTAPNDESFQPHIMLGRGIIVFVVLLTIVAALARVPGRLIGMMGLIAGLGVLQAVIAVIAKAFAEGEVRVGEVAPEQHHVEPGGGQSAGCGDVEDAVVGTIDDLVPIAADRYEAVFT